jgi:hypothetical protein
MIERILEADEASKIASTVGDLDFSKSPDPIDGLPSHMLRLNALSPEETTKKAPRSRHANYPHKVAAIDQASV